LRVVNLGDDGISNTVFKKSDFSAQLLGEIICNWSHGEFMVSFAIRPSKMRENDKRLGIVREDFVDGRNSG
jgi:hypothetical protein